MGRIFISAGHGGYENGRRDPGAVVSGVIEAQQMILLRNEIVRELRSRSQEVLWVPDDLSLVQTISWINRRAQTQDVALEIHADSFSNPNTRGATAFFITGNSERETHANQILRDLIKTVNRLPSRGAKPDTATGVGRLGFCRQVIIPSILLEVGFLTNPDDRGILLNQRQDMARGITTGLINWSRLVSGGSGESSFPIIGIQINSQKYEEQGILINSNSYIPIDLVDRLGVDLTQETEVTRVQYQGVVYVKAIELRDYNITISWDNSSRSVVLRSILEICPGLIDQIMGHGNTSEVQLQLFLKGQNEEANQTFPDIPKLYREEGGIEGVNYDMAFCQMCLETNFLSFGSEITAAQNNFARLGTAGGGGKIATFNSAREGVRAHIQHLKAYASQEPLVQEVVDPRFRFVTRGIAPLVGQLAGRWSADPNYGLQIISLLRQLYESANLL